MSALQRDIIKLIGIFLIVSILGYLAIPLEDKPVLDKNFVLGLDLQGGAELRYRVVLAEDAGLVEKRGKVDECIDVLRKRIDEKGLKEPRIQRYGADEILIQLPGKDLGEVQDVKEILETQGVLEFRLVSKDFEPRDVMSSLRYEIVGKGKRPSPEKAPPGTQWFRVSEKMAEDSIDIETEDAWLPLEKTLMTGEYIHRVEVELDREQHIGHYRISMEFTKKGATIFRKITSRNVGRHLAIVLDGVVHSAPVIKEEIPHGYANITGRFDYEDASDLKIVLSAGSLPAKIEPVGENFVGPSLGQDAIRRGTMACLIGLLAIVIFMIVYYRGAGIVASLVLAMNFAIILGIMSLFGATLTLPGIAGLVLIVGMAVDANILIFERIREEKERGREVSQAFVNGYSRAIVTIVDSNITTFLMGVVLYLVGTGAVKGFAVTLCVGILASMFTAVVASRIIFRVLMALGIMKQFSMGRLFATPGIKFLEKRNIGYVLSLILVGGGMLLFSYRGRDNFGIDFQGGTALHLNFEKPMEIDSVRETIQSYTMESPWEKGKYILPFAGAEVQSIHTMHREAISTSVAWIEGTSHEFEVRVPLREYRYRVMEGEDFEKISSKFYGDDRYAEHLYNMNRDALRIDSPKKLKAGMEVEIPDVTDVLKERFKKMFEGKLAPEPIIKAENLPYRDLDFRGGSLVQMALASPTSIEEIKKRCVEIFGDGNFKVEAFGPDAQRDLVRFIEIKCDNPNVEEVKSKLDATFPLSQGPFVEVRSIGSLVADEMKTKALLAVIASCIIMMIYIGVRFEFKFGIAAVVALVHDVLFCLGSIAAIGFFFPVGSGFEIKIELPIIAALLTIIGYSVNDSIVIFDRVRENMRSKLRIGFHQLLNNSINQTLSRTILTSLTTFMVVAILFAMNLVAGGVIVGFAFVMMAGVLIGTYSTMFIACPILLSWEKRKTEEGGK